MSTTEVDMNGSPTDRSKRPRLEDGDLDSDYERDGQDDRHPKRQAVPDPETKAPHFAGATDADSDNKHETNGTTASGSTAQQSSDNTPTGRSRRKKWEEGGSQDSDDGEDDEVQILLDANNNNKNEETKGTNGITNNDDASAAAGSTSAAPFDATGSDAQSLTSLPSGVPTVSIRSLVSTKDAGVIIGRGGKNVSEIREMSAARVTISDIIPGAYERILTVSGPVNSVAKVIYKYIIVLS